MEIQTLSASQVEVDLLPYGHTVHSIRVTSPSGAWKRDILVGPAQIEDHHHTSRSGRKFIGQTVGRYANRLPSGRVQVPGGAVLNSPGDGVCLHGGETGTDTVNWSRVPLDDTQLFKDKSLQDASREAIYSYVSPAGADGFPCKLAIEAYTAVTGQEERTDIAGRVLVALRAQLVDDGQSDLQQGSPVNLTVHWFFNCSDFRSEDVLDHRMFINADRTPTLDNRMLATGDTKNILPGADIDFYSQDNQHRLLRDNFPTGGVDHNLVFKAVDPSQPQVVLTSPDSKVSLSFRTNQSTVQCYTAGGFDSDGPQRKQAHDPKEAKTAYSRFGGVALEFQHPLATFQHKKYTEIAGTDTVLRGNDIYENWVEIEIKAKD